MGGNKNKLIVFISFGGIILLLLVFFHNNNKEKLTSNGCRVETTGFRIERDQDAGKIIKYFFSVDGIKYSGVTYLNEKNEKLLSNKKITVLYYCLDPSVNEIVCDDTLPVEPNLTK